MPDPRYMDPMISGMLYARALSPPPPDYTNQYNTELTPMGERLFQQQMGGRAGDLRDFDLRGAWLGNAEQSATGHYPDTFKKPNHPTFSSGSVYSTPQTPGGNWAQFPSQYATPQQGDPTAPWVFSPAPNAAYGQGNLEDYWRAVEPGNYLVGR